MYLELMMKVAMVSNTVLRSLVPQAPCAETTCSASSPKIKPCSFYAHNYFEYRHLQILQILLAFFEIDSHKGLLTVLKMASTAQPCFCSKFADCAVTVVRLGGLDMACESKLIKWHSIIAAKFAL